MKTHQADNYNKSERLRKISAPLSDRKMTTIQLNKRKVFIRSSSFRVSGKFRFFAGGHGTPKM
jgi:hypothetical protein